MKQVYLAGPIAHCTYEDAAHGWRLDAADELENFYDGVRVLSPMRGKYHLERHSGVLGSQAFEGRAMSSTTGILGRDRNDVKSSDAILMNLLGAQKVSIGTMVELGWADAFRIPVVLVMEKDGSNPHDHMFPKGLQTYWLDSMGDAIVHMGYLLNLRLKSKDQLPTRTLTF